MVQRRKTLPTSLPPLPEKNPLPGRMEHRRQSRIEQLALKKATIINKGLLSLLGEKKIPNIQRTEWQDFKKKLAKDLKDFLKNEGIDIPESGNVFLEQIKETLRQNNQYLMIQFLDIGNGKIHPVVMLHRIENISTPRLKDHTPPEIRADPFFSNLANPNQKIKVLHLGPNILNQYHKSKFQRRRHGTYEKENVIIFAHNTHRIAKGWAKYLNPLSSRSKLEEITDTATTHNIQNIIIPNEASQFYSEKFKRNDIQYKETFSDLFSLSKLRSSDNNIFPNFKVFFEWRLKSKLYAYQKTVKIFKELMNQFNISENSMESLNDRKIQDKIVKSLYRKLKKIATQEK